MRGVHPRPADGRAARRLGRRGERAAGRALRRAGYRVLARNVATPYGEVDLLALQDGRLVLVEVKTRGAGPPSPRRLGPRQRQRLGRAARWLGRRARGARGPVRRDLVLVHFEDRRPVVRILRGGA